MTTTLTFPRDMPAVGVGQQVFEPNRADFLSRDGTGRLGSIAAGFPLWQAQWTLASVLTTDLSDEWRAFLASLEGSSRLFFGYDVERLVPKAYARTGLGAWNGDASAWTQDISAGGVAELNVVIPVGTQIGIGDYCGFRWQTGGEERRALVRATSAAVADGDGVAKFAIEPSVPSLVDDEVATAYFKAPTCLMRLDSKNTQVTAMGRRRVAGAQITAIQDLLP